MKGVCRKITERSVVLKITIVRRKAINMNISLIREKTKVLRAALIV